MFKVIYFIGFIIMLTIRLDYRWLLRTSQIIIKRTTRIDMLLRSLAFVGIVVIPLIYVFTTLLNFADYQLPSWMGWAGAVVFAVALWLLWRSHIDLGQNWFDALALRKGHQLIINGSYKYIRHPMYAAIWMWGIAQALLLHNWIAGWSHLASFGALYFYRIPREEQMMLEYFGDEYQSYMKRTGRIFPRLKRSTK